MKKYGNKWDFWQWPGIPRSDGIQMREMINDIDETIRKTKAGTLTGTWKNKMFAGKGRNGVTRAKGVPLSTIKAQPFVIALIFRPLKIAQKKAELDFRRRQKKTIEEDPTAEGLFDERLGTVPFDLVECMIKDNRRCLESILGGFPKGIGKYFFLVYLKVSKFRFKTYFFDEKIWKNPCFYTIKRTSRLCGTFERKRTWQRR